ncbi:MAG: tetratricopeptide repeat protein [Ignavibacteria bacterium]|nr:tetratricopeptide repeat protein [Ignavibacteria bacterium]
MKFFLIIAFNFSIVFAQSNLDSLIKSISTKPDTTRIRILTDYCWEFRSKDPEKAIKSGYLAFNLAEKINNKSLQAKAINLIGVVYRNLGNFDKALSNYKKALQFAEEAKDSMQIAYSYNNIGGIYRLEGNNKLALDYILQALKFFEKIGDKKGAAFCTINVGLIYRNQESYLKALEYLNYTSRLRDEINDKPGKALALNLIAEVYFAMNEINVALKYYKEVEDLYHEVDDKKGLASVWNGIGGVYYLKKDYNTALEYRSKALELCIRIKYIEGEISSYNGLIMIYAMLNRFDKAEENLNRAKKSISNIRAAYLELNCYKSWSEYYELKKDYKQALLYNREYIALKDSVLSQENIELVSSMEAAYKSEKMAKENSLLLKDNELQKKQRNYFLIIAALVLVIGAILYNRYRAMKVVSDKYRELNIVKDKFFRIIAHDLRTPFNTILGYSEILKEDFNDLIDEEKLSLASDIHESANQSFLLLENLLVWSQAHSGSIEFKPKKMNLLNLINESISVHKTTARSKNLLLEINCPSDLEIVADEQMITTVIRNLVSNSIKFTETGKISVIVTRLNGDIKFIVRDTGIGMDEDTKSKLFKLDQYITYRGTRGEKGTGLGLLLCKEFIEKHDGKIWIESEINKGSDCIFTIPTG